MMLSFNIHGIFKFRVLGNNNKYMDYLEREYSYFKVRSVNNPDLIVYIGDFKSKTSGCTVVNHKYFVKKDFLYCRDSYKIVKWKVQIEGFEKNNTIIRFHSGRLGDYFLCRYVIEPFMRYKVNKKGYVFLHSSAVSKGKNAYLFFASKGVGKTSTILNLVNRGFSFMSDDYTILSKHGTVFSFPTTIHMFFYNVKQCPFILKKLGTRDKLGIKLRHLNYLLTMGYAQFPYSINVLDIFPASSIGKRKELKSLIFLHKVRDKGIIARKKINASSLAKKIVMVNKFEACNFLEYMLAYSFLFPKSTVARHWDLSEKNLISALKNKNLSEILVPEAYTDRIFKKINQLI